jgi:hypothetical protein
MTRLTLAVPLTVMLLGNMASAQVDSPEEVVASLLLYYDELNEFSETEAFQSLGFASTGPYKEWMNQVEALRQERGFFNGTGFLFCNAGQLINYGLSLIPPIDDTDAYIIEDTRSEFEACRARLEGN